MLVALAVPLVLRMLTQPEKKQDKHTAEPGRKAVTQDLLFEQNESVALGRLALLAIAADGRITDDEWRALLQWIADNGIPVTREALVERLGCPVESLANPALLERQVRALRPYLGPAAHEIAIDVIQKMIAAGAALDTPANYRRLGSDSRLLLQRFTEWLTD